MDTVLHLALGSDWAAASRSGEYIWSTRGLTIAQVGFMHCSFPNQLQGVFERFYRDALDDLLVLTLDVPALEARGMKLLVEPLDANDPASEAFPHLYGGTLPTDGISSVTPFRVPQQ